MKQENKEGFIMSEFKSTFIESDHVAIYKDKVNRDSFDKFYESERVTVRRCIADSSSLLDIGCLNGDTWGAIRAEKSLRYTGMDIDPAAIKQARLNFQDAEFIIGDFLDEAIPDIRYDTVLSLNLFDHFEDWKAAMRGFRRYATKYINFSTLLRADGPSVTDRDLSYVYYGGGKRRLLWAVHNIHELYAYAATEEIAASAVEIYCYRKYDDTRFGNVGYAVHSVHPLPIGDILVGNVVIVLDQGGGMRATKRRPDFKVVCNGRIMVDSPWTTK
jgi:hypothetical protein